MIFNSLKEVLAKYRSKGNDLITFEELKKFPVGEIIDIIPDDPGAIQTIRIDDSDSEDLSFRVVMKAGQSWTLHSHDCIETLLVYKGSLVDDYNKKEASRKQGLVIPKFVPHKIKAVTDCIFYVEFQKPNK